MAVLAGGPQEDFAGRARYDLANYGILAALRPRPQPTSSG